MSRTSRIGQIFQTCKSRFYSTRTAENFLKQLKMVSKVPNSQIHTSQIFQLFLKCSNISLNVSISPQKAQTLPPSSIFQHLKVPISCSSNDVTSRPPIKQIRFLIQTTQNLTCLLYRKLLDLGNEETFIFYSYTMQDFLIREVDITMI